VTAVQVALIAAVIAAGVLTLAVLALLIFVPTMADTGMHAAEPDAQRPDAGSRRYHHMTLEERRAWRRYRAERRGEGLRRAVAA